MSIGVDVMPELTRYYLDHPGGLPAERRPVDDLRLPEVCQDPNKLEIFTKLVVSRTFPLMDLRRVG